MAGDAGTASHVKVPCNGCRACCYQAVFLFPESGDDPSQYVTVREINPLTGKEQDMIPFKKMDGQDACHYLGEHGCTIYERAPAMCRDFDCRGLVKILREQFTRKRRRELLARGRINREIYEAGLERMGTL